MIKPFYDPEVERVKKLFTRSANNVSFAEWRDGGAYIRELAHNVGLVAGVGTCSLLLNQKFPERMFRALIGVRAVWAR